MSRLHRPSSRGGCRGMSLIEVMIAMVLLSFGLMGMLGLKLTGLKVAGQSNSRSLAAVHANDIIDRMRANPVRAVAGQYQIALAAAAPTAPVGVAQVDLAQWRTGIAQDLPGGTGSVLVQADGSVVVVVQWNERTDQSVQPQVLSFSFEARL